MAKVLKIKEIDKFNLIGYDVYTELGTLSILLHGSPIGNENLSKECSQTFCQLIRKYIIDWEYCIIKRGYEHNISLLPSGIIQGLELNNDGKMKENYHHLFFILNVEDRGKNVKGNDIIIKEKIYLKVSNTHNSKCAHSAKIYKNKDVMFSCYL